MRLLKVRGFRPKLFQSAEPFFASPYEEEGICLVVDVHLNGVTGPATHAFRSYQSYSSPEKTVSA
jgi:FixJ family two-component response regulator